MHIEIITLSSHLVIILPAEDSESLRTSDKVYIDGKQFIPIGIETTFTNSSGSQEFIVPSGEWIHIVRDNNTGDLTIYRYNSPNNPSTSGSSSGSGNSGSIEYEYVSNVTYFQNNPESTILDLAYTEDLGNATVHDIPEASNVAPPNIIIIRATSTNSVNIDGINVTFESGNYYTIYSTNSNFYLYKIQEEGEDSSSGVTYNLGDFITTIDEVNPHPMFMIFKDEGYVEDFGSQQIMEGSNVSLFQMLFKGLSDRYLNVHPSVTSLPDLDVDSSNPYYKWQIPNTAIVSDFIDTIDDFRGSNVTESMKFGSIGNVTQLSDSGNILSGVLASQELIYVGDELFEGGAYNLYRNVSDNDLTLTSSNNDVIQGISSADSSLNDIIFKANTNYVIYYNGSNGDFVYIVPVVSSNPNSIFNEFEGFLIEENNFYTFRSDYGAYPIHKVNQVSGSGSGSGSSSDSSSYTIVQIKLGEINHSDSPLNKLNDSGDFTPIGLMNIDDNGAIRSVEVFQVVNTNDQPLNIDGRNLTYSGGEYYGVMDDPSDNTKQAIVQLQTSSSSSSGGDNWNETESYQLESLIFTDNNDNYSTDAIEQFFDNASINFVKQTDSSQTFPEGA